MCRSEWFEIRVRQANDVARPVRFESIAHPLLEVWTPSVIKHIAKSFVLDRKAMQQLLAEKSLFLTGDQPTLLCSVRPYLCWPEFLKADRNCDAEL